MAKRPRPWTVMPHSPLEAIDDNLWGIVSAVPGFPRGTGRPEVPDLVQQLGAARGPPPGAVL